ncbi:hypothetical protein WJX73_001405 [Symbiochloris irregularis]|uniref:Uncharacterized protein n=1 Tax=Symbiochloris irregularis TaxID=706552 RepID=A0AAW1PZI1_9CHLO
MVLDASDVEAALTYGGGLGGATIKLTQSSPNSNSYTGTIDLDKNLGHNYTLAVTVTVDFCHAVQQTIQTVCRTAGSAGNFIATLDQKCQIFQDPAALPGQNVPVEKNFDVTVTGSASIPGAWPSPYVANEQHVLFQGMVDGVPGSKINIALAVPSNSGG